MEDGKKDPGRDWRYTDARIVMAGIHGDTGPARNDEGDRDDGLSRPGHPSPQ